MSSKSDVLEPPAPPIVDAEPAANAAAARASLDIAPLGGDPAPGASTDRVETRAGEGSAGDPPPPEKRGPGRPPGKSADKMSGDVGKKTASGRLQGTSRLTGKSLDKMMKSDIATTLEISERELERVRVELDDAKIEIAQLRTANTAGRGELIDDGIKDACEASIEFVANAAAIKFGPEAQVTTEERERLALLWSKVAKLYLGQHAQYSPLAAALLATGGVALDKYLTIEAAKKAEAASDRA